MGKHVSTKFETITECACVYTGSLGAARNLEGLRKRGVTHVLNASPIVPCFHRGHFRYKCVPVYDDVDEDISSFFSETNRFIAKVTDSPHTRVQQALAWTGHRLALVVFEAVCSDWTWWAERSHSGVLPCIQHWWAGSMCNVRKCINLTCLSAMHWSQGRRRGAVLVHCYAGQSRSVAFAIAYLCAYQRMSLAEAHELVLSARPRARPNAGAHYCSTSLSTPKDLRTHCQGCGCFIL